MKIEFYIYYNKFGKGKKEINKKKQEKEIK